MNFPNQPYSMPPQGPVQAIQAPEEDFIDLGRMFRAAIRYRWAILGLAFAITLVTGLFVYTLQPVYRASASIVLESNQANVVNVEDIYTVDTYDYNYTPTQYEILRSRNLAERVVRKLKLHQHPLFALPDQPPEKPWYSFDLSKLLPASQQEPPVQLTPEQKEEQVIQSLTAIVAKGLKVSPVEYSYVVYLSFESTDPKLAAQVVNAVAEEFIGSNLENRLSGTLQATEWLSDRLEDLKINLRESEQALQDFRDQQGLVNIEGVTGLGGNELTSLSQRLQDASKARIEAQNIMAEVKNLANANTDRLMTLPAVLQHDLVRDMKRDQSQAERRAAELAKRYGPKHPKMIAARSDLDAANADLSREVRKVVSGISREYDLALRNEEQLQEVWDERKTEIQDFNRVEFRLQELTREVETNRQLYDVFFTRIKNVSETGGFEKPHARIVDRALIPSSPVKPNKPLSITIAFMLGVMLGCGVAILLDLLDNTIKSPEDVQEKLHSPLLGTLAKQEMDRDGNFQQYWQDTQSQFAEAIRTIRTGVVLSSLDSAGGIIVVTSTLPGEGKSTLALNLGASLGQMENTLVIGGDLRRPSLARMCGIEPNHYGLSHFVSGSAELEDCIKHLEELNLHVMPAGIIPPNPLEMISSRRFVEALAVLRDKFDRIVIDSAPVQAVSDALILASYADSVIYVVKADATSTTQVQKGIASIIGSNEPLTGVVLNQLDVRVGRDYYGSKYAQYYSYESEAESQKA